MILIRGGLDLASSVPPGRRVRIRLKEQVIVSQSAMPVIGVTLEVPRERGGTCPSQRKSGFRRGRFQPGAVTRTSHMAIRENAGRPRTGVKCTQHWS